MLAFKLSLFCFVRQCCRHKWACPTWTKRNGKDGERKPRIGAKSLQTVPVTKAA